MCSLIFLLLLNKIITTLHILFYFVVVGIAIVIVVLVVVGASFKAKQFVKRVNNVSYKSVTITCIFWDSMFSPFFIKWVKIALNLRITCYAKYEKHTKNSFHQFYCNPRTLLTPFEMLARIILQLWRTTTVSEILMSNTCFCQIRISRDSIGGEICKAILYSATAFEILKT